jgi:hypothetical protein
MSKIITTSLVCHFFGAIAVSYLFKLITGGDISFLKIMNSMLPLTFTLWCGIAIGQIVKED